MLDNCRTAKERWGGVSDLIDRWLKERQELIIRLCELTDWKEFGEVEAIVKRLTEFCQALLDYVSSGHFEIYEQLLEEARAVNENSTELVNRLYPRIQLTTEAALDFNDRFDATPEDAEDLKQLLPELSVLAERLAERFEMEDMLIEMLYQVQSPEPA
jgi:regulator of sigma D